MINIGLDEASYKKYRKHKIKVGYYNAPITDLNGLECESKTCEECNQKREVFTLNPNQQNRKSDWICIECLTTIDIDATHFTEYGFVTSEEPFPDFLENARESVEDSAFQEMISTPHYLTIQGPDWLCHCDDFMDYLGTWNAPDFTKASPDGNGRNLFLQIIESYEDLWDDIELVENETQYTWEDALCHVFECRHCTVRRAYLEMS